MENTPEINAQLERLNKNLELQLSKRHIFLRGIITGVGSAIGATIIAGVIITILAKVMNDIGVSQLVTKLIATIS